MVTSCSKPEEISSKKVETASSDTSINDDFYTIRIFDIDGKKISEKNVLGDNFYNVLKNNFNVVDSNTDWGHFITSVDSSIVDSNYYLALYKNGSFSEVGVDTIEVKNKDIIDFKVECFNTSFDKYDLLVDKVIYSYAKDKLQNKLNNYNNYSSFPWELVSVNLMQKNNYDSIFNTDSLKEEYKESLINTNVNELTGTNFGKWYYGARACNLDNSLFKEAYKSYLEKQTEYGMYMEYEYPFTLSIAKDLGLESFVSNDLINTTYKASMEASGIAWQYTGLASYKKFTKEELESELTFERLNDIYVSFKDVAISSYILAYTANNINPRDILIKDSKDLIEYLFDNYYDEEKFMFTIEESDNDYSSNQIYSALMAYKVLRDKKKAANIFE